MPHAHIPMIGAIRLPGEVAWPARSGRSRRLRHACAALAALLLGAGSAMAAEPPPPRPVAVEPPPFGVPRQGFELNIGAGALLYPAYQGARVQRVVPFPSISGGYGERVEFDLLDGLRVAAVRFGGFSAGPAARFRFGRHTSDDRTQLRGLRSFGGAGELGGYIAYEAGPLALDAIATQDVTGAHGGAALDVRALLGVPLGRLGIAAGPELRLVTRRYAEAYYGISPSHSQASGRPAYSAAGGLERAGFLVSGEWWLTGRLALRGQAEYGRLLGSAAKSPLVRAGGSPDQFYAGLFLTWRLF